jgi:hypothetical protein
MGKHATSVDTQVLTFINGHPAGWVFTPAHLRDVGSRTAIETALRRHKKAGLIRQIARGLYERPRTHPKLGPLAPDIEAVAEALKTRDAIRLQPTGAYAANLLGLSDQVPMRIVYLTDGPTRRLKIGKLQISLRRTTPRNMATAGSVSGLVIQALRWLGRRNDREPAVNQLRKQLSDADKRQLAADAHYAPEWVAQVMRKIAQLEEAKG